MIQAAQAKTSRRREAFLKESLSALFLLGDTVNPQKEIITQVDALAQSTSLRERLIGFQLRLALRNRHERLALTLKALSDPEEAVRRGSIATLEREWPGDEQAGRALIHLVGIERAAYVRQDAVQALHRNWPRDPAILDALEQRADEERKTVAALVIRYLAEKWGDSERALRLVFRLVTRRTATKSRWYYHTYFPYHFYSYELDTQFFQETRSAVMSGWRGAPFLETRLRAVACTATDEITRLAAGVALLDTGNTKFDITDWANRILGGLPAECRVSVLEHLAQVLPASQELRALF